MSGRERFRDRVVLVTGASSGIGRACATALAQEGATLMLAGRRRERLDALAESIGAGSGRVAVAVGDVRESETAEQLVAGTLSAFGRLDGLVNAAGVLGNGSVVDGSLDEWNRVMDSNVGSLALMTRAAAKALIASRGAIVNISSVASFRPYAGLAAYCVSKAAVDMFTRCAALDFAPHGVRVNAVNPGVVVTELHTVTQAVADYPAFLERSKGTHPLGRVGQPEEVAALVLFLLSEESGWITGDTVSIDGGRGLLSAR